MTYSVNVIKPVIEQIKKVLQEDDKIYLEGANKSFDLPEFNSLEVAKNFINILDTKELVADMLNSGIIAMDGMKTGLSTSRAYSAGDAVKNNVIAGLNRSGLRDSMSGTGRYVMDGLNSGLEDRRSRIYKTAESIARGVTGRFAAVMQIKSPSRVFRKFGHNIDDGLVLGLEDGYEDIGRAIDKTADRITGVDLTIPTGRANRNTAVDSAANEPLNVVLNLGRNAYQAFVEDKFSIGEIIIGVVIVDINFVSHPVFQGDIHL